MSGGVIVKILFFAKARELAGGVNEVEFSVAREIKVGELLDKICDAFHLEAIKQSVILARNAQFCEGSEERLILESGDEIAVIPPISGG